MLFILLATNIQTSIASITTLHCCLPLQSNISWCSVASPVCIDSSTSPSRVIWAEAASMHTANTMRQRLSCRVCTRLSGTKHCKNDGYQRICFGCTCTWRWNWWRHPILIKCHDESRQQGSSNHELSPKCRRICRRITPSSIPTFLPKSYAATLFLGDSRGWCDPISTFTRNATAWEEDCVLTRLLSGGREKPLVLSMAAITQKYLKLSRKHVKFFILSSQAQSC